MRKPKFVRTDYMRYSRLGKNRNKKLRWRRARGKHSKIRRKRFGYPVMPTVGYMSPRKTAGLVSGLKPLLVHNLNELSKATKSNIVILARVGAKKKLDLIKKAQEMGIKIDNINQGAKAK